MTLADNFICRPYRGVSVQHWNGPLDEDPVKEVLLAREAYRRTEFVVLRGAGDATALVQITCSSQDALFNPVIAVALGVAILGEPFTSRMAIAAGLVFAGVAIVRAPRARTQARTHGTPLRVRPDAR